MSILLDTGVRYAEPQDVERYIRNKDFDSDSDPTRETVEQMILEASGEVDRRARRAWRLRQEQGQVLRVEWPRDISASHRRRRRKASRHGFVRPINRWGIVNLVRSRVVEIERLEVLLPRTSEDITAEEGRDGKYWVDERSGTLHIAAENFTTGPLRGSGLIKPAQVEVDFTFGVDEQGGSDTEAVSESVPDAIRRATAKLVAAELLDTDQYGSLVASGPENVPDQSAAATRLREDAEAAIDRWRIKKVM